MHAVAFTLIGFAWADSGARIQSRIEHEQSDSYQKATGHVAVKSYSVDDYFDQLSQGRLDAAKPEDFAMLLLSLFNPVVQRQLVGHRAQPAALVAQGAEIVHGVPQGLATQAISRRIIAPRAAADDKENLIRITDEMHEKNDVDAYFNLLVAADASDSDIAWRMARAYHDKAMESVGNDKEQEQLLRKGLEIAEKACETSGDGYSLKWYGILLGRLGDHLPTKEKVANSFKIKESLDASAAKLPEDSTVKTALGQWCYKVAGIGFVERQAANLLFGSPPKSSYQESLDYLLASYELRPSKKAALYAGLCYQKLNEKGEAAKWFQACLDLPSYGADDAEIDKQAKAAI